ncbi:MAG: GntR family transcriptional regulator [Defluviitaleaceae bacterium]|nr:GntR family transcriptional regulator [Defluviitaleaceae bacterium]
MKFTENTPIYIQIANDIKDQIISAKLAEGDKLRSIREYSVQYEVTALTMQRAIALLETEDVVHTKKGIGSFVNTGMKEILKAKIVEELVHELITRVTNMGLSTNEIISIIKRYKGGSQ